MLNCEGRPKHCRMFSSTRDRYLLDDSNTLVKTRNVSRHCQMSPGGQKSPWLRTTEPGASALEAGAGSLSSSNPVPIQKQQPLLTKMPRSGQLSQEERRWLRKGPKLTKERCAGGGRGRGLEEVRRSSMCMGGRGGGLESPAGNGVTPRRGTFIWAVAGPQPAGTSLT